MYEFLIVLSRPLISVLSCFEVDLHDIIVGNEMCHAIQQQQKQHILYDSYLRYRCVVFHASCSDARAAASNAIDNTSFSKQLQYPLLFSIESSSFPSSKLKIFWVEFASVYVCMNF